MQSMVKFIIDYQNDDNTNSYLKELGGHINEGNRDPIDPKK